MEPVKKRSLVDAMDALAACMKDLRDELVASRVEEDVVVVAMVEEKKPVPAVVVVDAIEPIIPEAVIMFGAAEWPLINNQWKPLVLHRIVDAKTTRPYWIQAEMNQPIYKTFAFHSAVASLCRKNGGGGMLRGIDCAEVPIGSSILRELYKLGIIKNPGQKAILIAADDERWSKYLRDRE